MQRQIEAEVAYNTEEALDRPGGSSSGTPREESQSNEPGRRAREVGHI